MILKNVIVFIVQYQTPSTRTIYCAEQINNFYDLNDLIKKYCFYSAIPDAVHENNILRRTNRTQRFSKNRSDFPHDAIKTISMISFKSFSNETFDLLSNFFNEIICF